MIKLYKIDRRYSGFGHWKYFVERPKILDSNKSKRLFLEWREWCWATWGASKELNMYDGNDLFDFKYSSNNHWCWLNDQHKYQRSRIYFKNDEDANIFILRWA